MLLRGNRLGKEIWPIDIGRTEAADVGQDHVGKAGGGFGIAQLLGNEIVEGAEGVWFVDMVAAGGHGVAADEVHQAGKRGWVDIHTEPVLHLEEQGGKCVGRHGVDWGYLKSGHDYSQSAFHFLPREPACGAVGAAFGSVGKIIALAMDKVPVSGSLKFSSSLSCGESG